MNDILPPGVDSTRPHSARVWNYWLGGKDNYPVDRELGDQILSIHPTIAGDARVGRSFLVRAITHLARQEGVRQFLDIGTGLPTHNNTHEVAQAADPACRVAYVDNDPMVLAHARALLVGTPEGATEFIDADLRETDQVITAARGLLDLDQPVALSVIGTLGHVPDLAQALGIIRAYRDALAPGSFVVLGDHVMSEAPESSQAIDQWNENAALAYRSHTVAELASYFDGWELLEPGVVPVTQWRPEQQDIGGTPVTEMYGGVARSRSRR